MKDFKTRDTDHFVTWSKFSSRLFRVKSWRVVKNVDRFQWKSQSEFCVVRAKHKFKSFGFVCSPSFFLSLPPFSRGVIFTRARVSIAPLSVKKNGHSFLLVSKVGNLFLIRKI